jgi:hypothetical protein
MTPTSIGTIGPIGSRVRFQPAICKCVSPIGHRGHREYREYRFGRAPALGPMPPTRFFRPASTPAPAPAHRRRSPQRHRTKIHHPGRFCIALALPCLAVFPPPTLAAHARQDSELIQDIFRRSRSRLCGNRAWKETVFLDARIVRGWPAAPYSSAVCSMASTYWWSGDQ